MIRSRFARHVFLLSALSAPVCAAVLEGIVLENRSGRPVARARVSLEEIHGAANAPAGTALTDSTGRFSFRSLAGGACLLSAQRHGYATAKYGQRRWDGPGTPIVVDPGGRFFAELRLQRLGVVTGEVLDENHLGLPGQPVYAYRVGRQPLLMVAAGVSDDRGVYRIPGLEPGRYYIRTGARELEDGRGLLPTFHGQSLRALEARQVDVQLDREAAGIDIEPLPGRLGQLSGKVLGGPATVVLFSDTGRREAHTAGDGAFQFDQLGPGLYELLATSTAEPPRAAFDRVRVGEGTVQATLALGRLPVLRVRCQEKTGRAIDPRRVSVFLRREEPPDGLRVRAQGGEAVPLSPGIWEAAALAPPEFYIESLRLPRAGNRFEALPSDTLDLTIVLSSEPASLRGTVFGGDGRPVPGAPVFLNAVDPELRVRLEGGRSTRAGPNGEFRFFGLPPGRYQLFSSFEIPEPQESEWGALPVSLVTLEEKEEASLDLKLIGGM